MSMRRWFLRGKWTTLAATALGASLQATPAGAAELVLAHLRPDGADAPVLDGRVDDWPATWRPLGVVVEGSADKGPPFAELALAADATHLRLALRTRDATLHRTKELGAGDDRLVLRLAFPRAGGGVAEHRVTVFPGLPGKLRALVRVDDTPVPGARAVEAQDAAGEGYTLEAELPWAAFPEAALAGVGLGATARYEDHDLDGRLVRAVSTAATRAGAALPALRTPAERALLEALRAEARPLSPDAEALGQLAGTLRLERVVAHGEKLAVVGPDVLDGRGYAFATLRGRAERLELRDLTGDGLAEVLVWQLASQAKDERRVFAVLRLDADDRFSVLFEHELGVTRGSASLLNGVEVPKDGALVLTAGTARGFGADAPPPREDDGLPPALVPWRERKRVFAWNGASFALRSAEDVPAPPAVSNEASATRSPTTTGRSAPLESAVSSPKRDEAALGELLAAYLRATGPASPRVTQDLSANASGSAALERIVLLGPRLLVFGTDLRGAAGYAYVDLPVATPSEIGAIEARDVTGDGRAELLVRLKQRLPLDANGASVAEREVSLLYQVHEGALRRLFAGETRRGLGDSHVETTLLFRETKEGRVLEVASRPAAGWTRESYPFASPPATAAQGGSIEPLLLPWVPARRRVYRFDGTRFALQRELDARGRPLAPHAK